MIGGIECPECGSNNVKQYVEADEYQCRDCGHGWAGYELA